MNNILVNSKDNLTLNGDVLLDKDGIYYLNISDSNNLVNLSVSDKVCVKLNIISNNTEFLFHINLGSNSNLTISILGLNTKVELDANLDKKDSKFSFFYSFINDTDSYNKISVNHLESNTESIIKNHGYSKNKASIILDVNGNVNSNSSKCIVKQDNQIIQKENSMSKINPNLCIDNYDVEASHSAYIGFFLEDSIFYLMSRGISYLDSIRLLLQAFLLGNLDIEDDYRDSYIEIINEFIR